MPEREVGVYPNLVVKLSMSNPDRSICEKYLEAIADNAGIELNPSSSSDEAASAEDSHEKAPVKEKAPIKAKPESPTKTTTKPPQGQAAKSNVPDFDELTRRFEELRSKKP